MVDEGCLPLRFAKILFAEVLESRFGGQMSCADRVLFFPDSPIHLQDLGGPRGENRQGQRPISATRVLADFGADIPRNELQFRPYIHAHIPRITSVKTTPSN